MAVYSMTGYATASSGAACEPLADPSDANNTAAAQRQATRSGVTAELRSVNGRFLEVGLRLPDELRSMEPALRNLICASFRRGKIELRLHAHRDVDQGWPQPRPEQLSQLARLEDSVRNWMPNAQGLTVQEVLRWCDGDTTAKNLDAVAMEATRSCAAGLREAREREGARLATGLEECVNKLRELAVKAEPLVPAVVQRQQQRFIERWNEALEATGAHASMAPEVLQEHAIKEAVAYSIRIDVAEELARLRSHLDEVARLLSAGGEIGKRLDFLVQELLREANTLGSKSATLELTNVAVEMKVSIEQLREQVQNIE